MIKTDVLIIGNGGAGARAALEATKYKVDVLIVSKTMQGKAHTTMAEGGINAALGNRDPTDSWEEHFKDTVVEGAYLNNQPLVEILTKEVIDSIYDLEEYGAVFDRLNGKIAQRFFGAQSHPRTCYVGDETGHEIQMSLVEECRRRGIRYMNEVFVTKLLTYKDRVIGATAIDMKTGEFIVFQAKSIVLATGGAGRIYKITSNPSDATGDGYAMSYRIGAELMDMEQVQFHPTGMVYPESAKGILVTEAVRGEGGYLLNNKYERYMKRYNPSQMELSPRDVVARANYLEIKSGRGTEHGGVYLDIRHLPSETIKKKLPRMVKQFKELANIDITNTLMEVAPTVHHFMGGIKISEENNMSNIKGLFPAGEAEAGVHGGNRLGGNALAETQVFGARAGKYAALFALENDFLPLNQASSEVEFERLLEPFNRKKGVKPQVLKKKIQDIMWKYVGIVRNEEDLRTALNYLENLKKEADEMWVSGTRKYNPEWFGFIEVHNMLLTSELVVKSALFRKESRGAHYRSDYPELDNKKWLVNININSKKIYTTPVVITRLDPR